MGSFEPTDVLAEKIGKQRAGKLATTERDAKESTKVQNRKRSIVKQSTSDPYISKHAILSSSKLEALYDIDMIMENLSEHIKADSKRSDLLRIAKSVQKIMNYNVTAHEVWAEISRECKTIKLYACDPDPRTFDLNGNTVEGRGNLLLSYETEVFPGIHDEMSVTLPARFKLELEDGEPRVTSVEI